MNETIEADDWNDLVGRWINIVAKSLVAYGLKTAAGERIVLLMNVPVQELRAVVEAASRPNVHIKFQTVPDIVPIDAFVEFARTAHPDPTFHIRIRPQLQAMDPDRHVAVEIRSEVGTDAAHTRFLILDSHLI